MSRNQNKPFYEKITISDIGAEGKSLAKVGDKVVFTTHAIPGDVVDLQVTVKKRKYEEARIVRYHHYSEDRAEPFCSHFGLCGGCKWQNLPYPLQLHYKQKQVGDQLTRIGRLELPGISPILGSSLNRFYRNKLEFSFSNNRWLTQEELGHRENISDRNVLGFHVPGMFDKIFHVEKCWLQPEPSNAIRNWIFEYARDNGLSFFDIKAQQGFLRSLIIRTSTTGEAMVILTFFHENQEKRTNLLRSLMQAFPGITSLHFVINSKGNDTITDQEVLLFSGRAYIEEEMEGLRFRIGPKSFYQTNSLQSLELYRKVRELAGLTGEETVYDLYSGTGTISLFLARHCKKVVGMEYVPEATTDARINADNNGIGNARFFAGDIRNLLNREFIGKEGHPDVVITDPPRSGMHANVVESIVEAAPSKIVYVSCNPATQARDLSLLNPYYSVTAIQPVDMFPHTHHVENIVRLIRREDRQAGDQAVQEEYHQLQKPE